jgi:hypothetical protein
MVLGRKQSIVVDRQEKKKISHMLAVKALPGSVYPRCSALQIHGSDTGLV